VSTRHLPIIIASWALLLLVACPPSPDDDDSAPPVDDDDATDDDDSAPDDPVLTLRSVSIDCVDQVVGAREQTSVWTITARFEPGWAIAPALMIWDQAATDGFHYFDPWQPFGFTGAENVDFGPDGSFDVWTKTLDGFSTIGEAEVDEQTIFRCYDSGGNEQVAAFNFMLCASDFHYEDSKSCWFVGEDFGEPAGTAAAPDGTVGALGDHVATDTWEPGAPDSPFAFSASNPD